MNDRLRENSLNNVSCLFPQKKKKPATEDERNYDFHKFLL